MQVKNNSSKNSLKLVSPVFPFYCHLCSKSAIAVICELSTLRKLYHGTGTAQVKPIFWGECAAVSHVAGVDTIIQNQFYLTNIIIFILAWYHILALKLTLPQWYTYDSFRVVILITLYDSDIWGFLLLLFVYCARPCNSNYYSNKNSKDCA